MTLEQNQIDQLPQSKIENLASDLAGKEPAITKNTAFNKDFGTTAGTVLEGSKDAEYAKLADDNIFTGLNSKGDTWTDITLLNGWLEFSSLHRPRYRKTPEGTVFIQGLVKSGSSGTVCTLPSGFRPAQSLYHRFTSSTGSGYLNVTTSGNVILTGYNSGTWNSLEFVFTTL